MTTKYEGFEVLPDEPGDYHPPTKYRITYSCSKCGHQFTKTHTDIPKKEPKCPNKACAEQSELAQLRKEVSNLRAMLESGEAPAQIGHRPRTKAIDTTAEVVMQDYGLTNLKDNIRHGETMAPKLPGPKQDLADNYFGGQGLRTMNITPGTPTVEVSAKQVNLLGRRALAGAFRGMAVTPGAIAPRGARPGEKALHMVRTEPTGKRER